MTATTCPKPPGRVPIRAAHLAVPGIMTDSAPARRDDAQKGYTTATRGPVRLSGLNVPRGHNAIYVFALP